MTTRKPCINISSATYSGKEQSPLHFGLSAEGYENDTIMEGYDKMLWIVKVKNNKKVWVRHSCANISKMIHEEPVLDGTLSLDKDLDSTQHSQGNNNEHLDISDDSIVIEPVITTSSPESNSSDVIKSPNVPIMKAVVEEKKVTDYNLFLPYRLHELKQQKTEKTNKEIFNIVVAEWKELKKNPVELSKVIAMAQKFHKSENIKV